jgi:hypothetical protein
MSSEKAKKEKEKRWPIDLLLSADHAIVLLMNTTTITTAHLLTTMQALLLTYRFNGGSVQDAADAFQMNRLAVRTMEADAMQVLREAGYDNEAIRAYFTA